MFTDYPNYDKYRTLELKDLRMKGEDVFALQTALTECGFPCGTPDGILGPLTDRAIRNAQSAMLLVVDGKAGGATQKALALKIANVVATATRVRYDALMGTIEHESGYRLGIYSDQRTDGSYDAGVTQRNTKFTSPQIAFDCSKSIQALAENTKKHFSLFAGVSPVRRRWELAQGAWNAPAFACYIAKEEGATAVTTSMTLRPSSASRATLEAYIDAVSKYLQV
jgi:peptidoglycan hydrolase-like protein with peptidoglycan-binding domain